MLAIAVGDEDAAAARDCSAGLRTRHLGRHLGSAATTAPDCPAGEADRAQLKLSDRPARMVVTSLSEVNVPSGVVTDSSPNM